MHGQDILHVDVYDEDYIFDDKIGSAKVNLHELYEIGKNEGFAFFLNSEFVFFVGHVDHWYDLRSKFGGSSHGQVHLVLDYQPLKF